MLYNLNDRYTHEAQAGTKAESVGFETDWHDKVGYRVLCANCVFLISHYRRTRGPGKRRKHNSDDDGDDDADEIDSASDAEGGERAPSSAAGDDDDEVSGSESEGQHEEDLGRGARSRAKVRSV